MAFERKPNVPMSVNTQPETFAVALSAMTKLPRATVPRAVIVMFVQSTREAELRTSKRLNEATTFSVLAIEMILFESRKSTAVPAVPMRKWPCMR